MTPLRPADDPENAVTASPGAPTPAARLQGSARDARVWLLFVVVHAWQTYLALGPQAPAYTDVDLYRWWVQTGLDFGQWPVLDGPWVYPAGALLPVLVPAVVSTTSTAAYVAGWCAFVTLLDAVAVALLLRHRAGHAAAVWWLAFLLLLGPAAMGRLDGVVAPITIAALLVALTHPRTSALLVTVGAWIKIAPGAAVIPLLMASRRPWRDVVEPAVLVCAIVVGTVVALGGGAHLLSFILTQDARDLQIESVAATPWIVAAMWTPTILREYDTQIFTFEVHGPGTRATADVLGALLPVAVLAAAALLWWCRRRAGERFWSDDALRSDFVVRGTFALTLLLIITNKVGSPQFVAWLAPSVAVGLALGAARWRGTAVLLLAVAAATQAIYPWWYAQMVNAELLMTLVLVARNVALIVLLVMAVRHLVRAAAPPPAAGEDPAADEPSGAVRGEPGEEVRA